MPETALAPAAPRCVWMDAGLIRYRLCNRGFDCEHCLLNAALCGSAGDGVAANGHGAWTGGLVPDDRIYGSGHTWMRALNESPNTWRFGLDPFAAALLGRPTRIEWAPTGTALDACNAICRIESEAASIHLLAPVPARLVRPNHALRTHPGRLLADPCDSGWIAELRVHDPSAFLGFLSPAAARERIARDLIRFRHAVALELLADSDAGPASIGQPLADVRRLLGAPCYQRLLCEFVH